MIALTDQCLSEYGENGWRSTTSDVVYRPPRRPARWGEAGREPRRDRFAIKSTTGKKGGRVVVRSPTRFKLRAARNFNDGPAACREDRLWAVPNTPEGAVFQFVLPAR
jgi:hypothetical protein